MPIVLNGTTGITTPQVTTDDGEAYAPGNILGTVSQSGGVPTGAIIERGSNANGEFVKYADGTLICTRYDDVAVFIAANTVTAFTWTLPISFINANYFAYAIGTPTVSGSVFGVTFVGSSLSTSIVFVFGNGATAQNLVARRYLAIGRWY